MRSFILIKLLCFSLAVYSQDSGESWNIFRGSPELSGRTSEELPDNPVLLWSVATGASTKSSPVISDGLIYFGNDKGELIAVTTEGRIKCLI